MSEESGEQRAARLLAADMKATGKGYELCTACKVHSIEASLKFCVGCRAENPDFSDQAFLKECHMTLEEKRATECESGHPDQLQSPLEDLEVSPWCSYCSVNLLDLKKCS